MYRNSRYPRVARLQHRSACPPLCRPPPPLIFHGLLLWPSFSFELFKYGDMLCVGLQLCGVYASCVGVCMPHLVCPACFCTICRRARIHDMRTMLQSMCAFHRPSLHSSILRAMYDTALCTYTHLALYVQVRRDAGVAAGWWQVEERALPQVRPKWWTLETSWLDGRPSGWLAGWLAGPPAGWRPGGLDGCWLAVLLTAFVCWERCSLSCMSCLRRPPWLRHAWAIGCSILDMHACMDSGAWYL